MAPTPLEPPQSGALSNIELIVSMELTFFAIVVVADFRSWQTPETGVLKVAPKKAEGASAREATRPEVGASSVIPGVEDGTGVTKAKDLVVRGWRVVVVSGGVGTNVCLAFILANSSFVTPSKDLLPARGPAFDCPPCLSMTPAFGLNVSSALAV